MESNLKEAYSSIPELLSEAIDTVDEWHELLSTADGVERVIGSFAVFDSGLRIEITGDSVRVINPLEESGPEIAFEFPMSNGLVELEYSDISSYNQRGPVKDTCTLQGAALVCLALQDVINGRDNPQQEIQTTDYWEYRC